MFRDHDGMIDRITRNRILFKHLSQIELSHSTFRQLSNEIWRGEEEILNTSERCSGWIIKTRFHADSIIRIRVTGSASYKVHTLGTQNTRQITAALTKLTSKTLKICDKHDISKKQCCQFTHREFSLGFD